MWEISTKKTLIISATVKPGNDSIIIHHKLHPLVALIELDTSKIIKQLHVEVDKATTPIKFKHLSVSLNKIRVKCHDEA